MITRFIGMISNYATYYIPLCCSKSNTSDTPPECIEANNLGIGVLSVETDVSQDDDQDTEPGLG